MGAKSMSESPYNPVAAALGNAIADATGIRFTATPFKPDRLWPRCMRSLGSPVRCSRRAPSQTDGGSRVGSGERPIPQFECRMADPAGATLLVALLRRLLGAGRSLDRLARVSEPVAHRDRPFVKE
jgi:hypothetical protein